jgi:hypothetical protein
LHTSGLAALNSQLNSTALPAVSGSVFFQERLDSQHFATLHDAQLICPHPAGSKVVEA